MCESRLLRRSNSMQARVEETDDNSHLSDTSAGHVQDPLRNTAYHSTDHHHQQMCDADDTCSSLGSGDDLHRDERECQEYLLQNRVVTMNSDVERGKISNYCFSREKIKNILAMIGLVTLLLVALVIGYKIRGSPNDSPHISDAQYNKYIANSQQIVSTINIKPSFTSSTPVPSTSTKRLPASIRTTATSASSQAVPSTSSSIPAKKTDNSTLFADVNHMRKLLTCEPRPVKVSLYKELQPTNSALMDKELQPEVFVVMRCDSKNSYCGDQFGIENSDTKCMSIKSQTRTHRFRHQNDKNKNEWIYENIGILEDLECGCIKTKNTKV